MSFDRQIDELLEAGWEVLDSDFDPVAFQSWRRKALDCLTAMFGPDHVYTRHFESFVRQGEKKQLLAAGGILFAAKEQASCIRSGSTIANVYLTPINPTQENHGLNMSENQVIH
jgi:hypothetical protein